MVNVGQPAITPAFTNISPAGEPIIIKAGVPDTITPGTQGNKLPGTPVATIRKHPARNRRLKKAMPAGIINGTNNIFEYLDIEQGLASGNILTIFQDKKGNIWLGTNGEGIIKYDGINFLQFTSNEGLPNNWVRAILEDKSGNISIGTTEGLQYFDRTTGSFPCLQPANKSNWKTRPLMI
jgi:ligand-binding sensor domain-containing protein